MVYKLSQNAYRSLRTTMRVNEVRNESAQLRKREEKI